MKLEKQNSWGYWNSTYEKIVPKFSKLWPCMNMPYTRLLADLQVALYNK